MFRRVGRAQHTKGERNCVSPYQRNCVCVSTTPLVWVESYGSRSKSLDRRSRYSIRPVTFECGCFLPQNAFWGSGTARHLGPTPRGRLKFGRMLACQTRTARNPRVKDARRSVTNRAVERRIHAISADWRFWLWDGKTASSRNGDI